MIKAPWVGSMRRGKIAFILWLKSFVMHLYNMLQQEIGLKSVADWGLGTLGRTMSLVALIKPGMSPVWKNSWMAEHTSGPTVPHAALKNPLLCPSDPGDLKLGIEKIASLMSLLLNGLHNPIWSSHLSVRPRCITCVFMLFLVPCYLPSRFL